MEALRMVLEQEASDHTETFDAKLPADLGFHMDYTEALEDTEVEA